MMEHNYLATQLHKTLSNLILVIFPNTCHIWLKLAVASNVLGEEGTERQTGTQCTLILQATFLQRYKTEIQQITVLRHVLSFPQKATLRDADKP